MEIIIEYVLIDNLVIDFLILFLSCKILKHKVAWWRLLIASILGSLCALFLPIINIPTYALIAFKLTLGALMVLISLPCRSLKESLASFLVFLLMTGGMGGICFLLIFMISGSLSLDVLVSYSSEIPIGFILFTCSMIALLIAKLTKLFYRKKSLNNFIYETKVLDNGKEIKVNAFLDSGNTLIDPITSKPVIIISFSLFNRLYDLPLVKVLTKNIDECEIKNPHYITFGTVGKKSDMLVFEIEEMELIFSKIEKKQFRNVVLGLSFSNFKKTFSCDALLNPMFVFEEGYNVS